MAKLSESEKALLCNVVLCGPWYTAENRYGPRNRNVEIVKKRLLEDIPIMKVADEYDLCRARIWQIEVKARNQLLRAKIRQDLISEGVDPDGFPSR